MVQIKLKVKVTNFRTQEIPRSGSKAKDGEGGKKKKKKRLNDGNKIGQLRIANATSGGACKAAWANCFTDKVYLTKVPSEYTETVQAGNSKELLFTEFLATAYFPPRKYPQSIVNLYYPYLRTVHFKNCLFFLVNLEKCYGAWFE